LEPQRGQRKEGGVTNDTRSCKDIACEAKLKISVTFFYKVIHFHAPGILCLHLSSALKKIPFNQFWFEVKEAFPYLH
jgi:hypothetical protein